MPRRTSRRRLRLTLRRPWTGDAQMLLAHVRDAGMLSHGPPDIRAGKARMASYVHPCISREQSDIDHSYLHPLALMCASTRTVRCISISFQRPPWKTTSAKVRRMIFTSSQSDQFSM